MPYLLALFMMIFPIALQASDKQVVQALSEFSWKKRQVIVFTPSPEDQRFVNFQSLQDEFSDDFSERFLHVWMATPNKTVLLEDMPHHAIEANAFYQYFDVKTDAFRVLLIGYDQGEKLRQTVFDLNELLGEIDQMPMRQQEVHLSGIK